ncbi:hypothetical protein DV735_g1003, partial [Chaetothyriales sp. CBS 134920]
MGVLNDSQEAVIRQCQAAVGSLILCHGPPGTGKTYLARNLVAPFVKHSRKVDQPLRSVLCCSTSNKSIDSLAMTGLVLFQRNGEPSGIHGWAQMTDLVTIAGYDNLVTIAGYDILAILFEHRRCIKEILTGQVTIAGYDILAILFEHRRCIKEILTGQVTIAGYDILAILYEHRHTLGVDEFRAHVGALEIDRSDKEMADAPVAAADATRNSLSARGSGPEESMDEDKTPEWTPVSLATAPCEARAPQLSGSGSLEPAAGFAPRADRGTDVTVDNAQGIWPAEAVVFVANLSARRSLQHLQHACHEIFDAFGCNVIKVKLDRNNHPFALVQFEDLDAATTALARSRGVVLDGRPLRLEQGKAERAAFISRKDGAALTEREARAVLEPFGALCALVQSDSVCGPGPGSGSGSGFMARFVYYQDCRDAIHAFSAAAGGLSSVYRLQLATGPQYHHHRGVGGASPDDDHVAAAADDEDNEDAASHRAITEPYDHTPTHHLLVPHPNPPDNTTSMTIFVGNLPPDTTALALARAFADTGTVVDARVVTRPRYGHQHQGWGRLNADNTSYTNTFGFVDFATAAEAAAAVRASVDMSLAGER